MWKPFLLSIGIYLCVLGGECLILERAVLARESKAAPQQSVGIFGGTPMASLGGTKKQEIKPSEWAPWSFLSVGAVVILYGLTMNRE